MRLGSVMAEVGRPGGGFLFLDEQLHELLSIETR